MTSDDAAMDTSSLKNAEQSECFYAVYGLVDTADMMAYDFQNVVAEGSFNWFNVAAYDPLHFAGDSSISYQYCGGQTQVNNAVSAFSGDFAYLSQFGTTAVSYLITEAGNLKEQFDATNIPNPNSLNLSHAQVRLCFHFAEAGTEFCDDENNCARCPEGPDHKVALQAEMEDMLTNKLAKGEIWGNIAGNMFGAFLDAPI